MAALCICEQEACHTKVPQKLTHYEGTIWPPIERCGELASTVQGRRASVRRYYKRGECHGFGSESHTHDVAQRSRTLPCYCHGNALWRPTKSVDSGTQDVGRPALRAIRRAGSCRFPLLRGLRGN